MAKNGPMEIVEQHLEKLILGVCVLLFVLAVGYWGLTSPRRVQLPGIAGQKKSSPGEVDQQLQDMARTVMRQVQAKEPNLPPASDYVDQIERLFRGVRLPHDVGAFGTPTPSISTTEGPEVKRLSLPDLTAVMPAPSKPQVKAVRVLPNRLGDNQTDELVAHVLAVYPWQELSDSWKTKVGVSGVPYRPAAIGLLVQVQEQLPDGGWGSPREVTGVYEPVLDSMGTPYSLPKVPAYDGTNAGYLAQLRAAVAEPAWQAYLLQPNYWQIWWPGYGWVDWRVNLPDNDVSKAATAFIAQLGGTAPDGTYQSAALPAWAQPDLTLQPFYASAASSGGYDYEREEEEYDYAQPRAATLVEQIPAPQMPLVPDILWQFQHANVLVWLHDDSLQPLKVYRYRLAVKFLNPLLGFDNVVRDPSYAATPWIPTPFSPWSDPVEIPQSTEFFLAGASETQGRVTVFTRSTGQQVKERFTVVPGQSIGGVKNIELTNPADQTVGNVPVDFSTGAIAVQFNIIRTTGRSLVEMLYLDEKGDLRSKVDINSLPRNDREYLRYKELEEKEKVTRLAAEAAKVATTLTPP